MTRQALIDARQRARTHVQAVRDATVCEECEGQPIEWHSETHPDDRKMRISMMASRGCSVEAIDAEIARCRALCRRCHMTLDGRLDATLERNRAGKYTDDDVTAWHDWLLAEPGRTVRQVAQHFGVGHQTVTARFKRLDLPFDLKWSRP